MKLIYFIMNYFIQLSCMLLGWNTVNEFYLKPVKVKPNNKPHRYFFIRKVKSTLRQF